MYSQNQEEKYILEYFGHFVGHLLDIGANDGKTYSNSRALMEKGWFGDLVEPSPKAFNKLSNLYKDNDRVMLWNAAITNEFGIADFYESGPLVSKYDSALVSSVDKDELKRWPNVTFEKISVRTIRIKEISNCPRWDFISIDAEGFDLEILRQIDLINVGLLCVEWNGNERVRQEILEYTSKFHLENILYISSENLLICTN
jgi:FkbM family methyltransferase